VLLRQFAALPLLTGGVRFPLCLILPQFFWVVLVTRVSVVKILPAYSMMLDRRYRLVVVFGCALISSRPVWYCCSIWFHSGGIQLHPSLHTRHGIVAVFGFAVAVSASPLSLPTQCGIVAVFSFSMAVFGYACISSHPASYRCGIWLRCGGIWLRPGLLTPSVVSFGIRLYGGGIRLRPYDFTSGVVSLQYLASQWYSAKPVSLHAPHGIVAVFGFAVGVFGFALISSCLAWYRCSILLSCSGILLRPYLL